MEFPEHEVGGVPLLGDGANSESESRELLGAEFGDQALEAVMAAGAAFGAQSKLAHFQGKLVDDAQDVLGFDLVLPAQVDEGFAGEVHKGLWLDEVDLIVAPSFGREFHVALSSPGGRVPALSQKIQDHEADVVSSVLIAGAGVSQADQCSMCHFVSPMEEGPLRGLQRLSRCVADYSSVIALPRAAKMLTMGESALSTSSTPSGS